ncbi:uncharacterized protein [Montipora capricornis]|uniref:uncharacterized protein n=1 Tax=Montipora capricornis TaxID=246305 RepID=UPI0035F1B81F
MAERGSLSFDETFAEVVRNYRVLYDKECKDFKDKNKKLQAWEKVANEMGMTKDDAQTYFRNMRNKYSREKKKLGKAKVSGAGQDDVTEVKKDLSGMYPYLQWLEPYIVERKTKSNFGGFAADSECCEISDSDNESSASMSRSITPDGGLSSDASQPELVQSSMPKAQKASWKFHKQTNESKKKKSGCEEAELELIQSLGASIAKQGQVVEKEKDEDDIFGTLIASQLRQLPPDKKIWVKMQISNMVYEQMMHSIGGVSQYQTYPSYHAETSGNPFRDPKAPFGPFS